MLNGRARSARDASASVASAHEGRLESQRFDAVRITTVAKLRATLPKDLSDLVAAAANTGDYVEVHAALVKCDVDARGGYGKGTALMLRECTPELARWLVDRGTDLDAVDTTGATALHRSSHQKAFPAVWRWEHELPAALIDLGADVHARTPAGMTPLHTAVVGQRLAGVRALLAAGAEVDAPAADGATPLEHGLAVVSNVDLEALAPVVELLVAAGATVSDRACAAMRSAGETFEFHRAGFNPAYVDAAAAAVISLCELLGVDVPPQRRRHDGKSPIVAETARWQDQHGELWDFLVPSKGHCDTVQGEVIRISGRLGDEIARNGGANWDGDYRAMGTAFCTWIDSGAALDSDLVAECRQLVQQLPETDTTRRLCELATVWVSRNPQPARLSTPTYDR